MIGISVEQLSFVERLANLQFEIGYLRQNPEGVRHWCSLEVRDAIRRARSTYQEDQAEIKPRLPL